MLAAEHEKVARELERRVSQLREDGVDPTFPQKPRPAARSPAPRNPTIQATLAPPTSSSPPPGQGRGRLAESTTVDESFMVLGARVRIFMFPLPWTYSHRISVSVPGRSE
jgi:anti-sigma factor RsiW